jgi:hypothetical protein
MEPSEKIEVDMTLLEKVHGDMIQDAKVLLVMMLSSLHQADPVKNAQAIEEAIIYCADTMAHKIAFQYAIHKGADVLERKTNLLEKNMLGFVIMSEACEVHQKLREALQPFFREQWEKLRRSKEQTGDRLN